MFVAHAIRNRYGRRCHLLVRRSVACRVARCERAGGLARARESGPGDAARRATELDQARLSPVVRLMRSVRASRLSAVAGGQSLDWSDSWVVSFGGSSSASSLAGPPDSS